MEPDASPPGPRLIAGRIFLLLILLLSPVGAPAIGYILLGQCFEGFEAPTGCSIPQPLIDYFLPFAILPAVWVGPFLAILWFLSAAGILIALAWQIGRLALSLTFERL